MGLGAVADATVLGGPLNFSVALRLDDGEVLTTDCVKAEVMVGESRVPANQVQVQLRRGEDASITSVRVRTGVRIEEPVSTVTLSLGCPARLVRQFVVLADPPQLSQVTAVPDISTALPEVAGRAPEAATATALAGEKRAALRKPGLRAGSSPSRPLQSASTKKPGVSKPPRAVVNAAVSARTTPTKVVKPSTATGSRLSLEPPAPDATPVPAGASKLPAATLNPVPDPAGQQRAVEDLRMAALEASLNRLQAEHEANRERTLALQARLVKAESGRYANPLVYALLSLVLLLAAAVVYLALRQRQLKRLASRPPWWTASAGPSSLNELPDSSFQSRFDEPLPAMTPKDVWPTAPSRMNKTLTPEGGSGAGNTTPASPSTQAASASTAPMTLDVSAPAATGLWDEPKRAVAVEELIDLEQQAEFFRVLGQEQAAVDLLMEHVKQREGRAGVSSPMPYLKLLDIHRRRGDREDYERLRERFNQRFSAYAPPWGDDLTGGLHLEDYPEVLAQLQRLWVGPKNAMVALEALLFRHEPTDTTFELPAYLQLLFLYSVARDLVDSEIDPSRVDLDLPMDAG